MSAEHALGDAARFTEATHLREISGSQWKSGIAAWLGWLFDGLEMHLYTLVATPLVVHRAGEPEPDLGALKSMCIDKTQPQRVEMPAADVSSTEIRRRLMAGQPIDPFVPPAVAEYIGQHNLYRAS